jgi:putative transposase
MPKQINYTLNPDQLVAIETAMNHDVRPEVRQRATAIRLLHLGHLPDTVAEMLAVTPGSIYNWHRRWKRAGLEGLANEPKSGRPSKANEVYIRLLEETLEKDPADLGLDFVVWTINRLRLYLAKQTGILLSYTRFRSLLGRLDYVYRRPKHDLTDLQNAEAKQVAEEVLDWLKKSVSTEPSSASLWTKRP